MWNLRKKHLSDYATYRELRISVCKFFHKATIKLTLPILGTRSSRDRRTILVTRRKYSKHLPWVLPAMVFLFDFVDMQWMFSHEPGLSYDVVRRFQLLLLPGT